MLKSDGTDDRSFCAGLPVIRLSRRQTPQIYNKLCYRREAAQLSMEIVFSVPEGWKIVLGKYNCPSLRDGHIYSPSIIFRSQAVRVSGSYSAENIILIITTYHF